MRLFMKVTSEILDSPEPIYKISSLKYGRADGEDFCHG